MALKELINLSTERTNRIYNNISEEKIKDNMENLRRYIAYWRYYPDLFVDFLCGDNPENFHLFPYQRIVLRAIMRHRYVYCTFPRAYSKSFLSVLSLMLRCILYPNSHLFVTSGGK